MINRVSAPQYDGAAAQAKAQISTGLWFRQCARPHRLSTASEQPERTDMRKIAFHKLWTRSYWRGLLLFISVAILSPTALAQEREKATSPEALQERLRAVEEALKEQRHTNDLLLKRIDDLNWRDLLGEIARIEKIRYTGPKRHQPNPTAQNAGNPLIVYAYVFIPKKLEAGRKYPLLVFPHGGVRSNFSTKYATVVRELIEQGYVVVAPDYRGSTGYGEAFYNQIDYGGREIEDVYLGGQSALEQYSFLDRTRVGILGWSHGGFIT